MSRKLDTEETILELQGRKSDLLLEAQLILASGNTEEAIERFAAAAPMEERIADFYSKRKDVDETARHKFSAAVCYAKSGSLREAIRLFDVLSRDAQTPGRLIVDAILFGGKLRQQQHEALQTYSQTLQTAGLGG